MKNLTLKELSKKLTEEQRKDKEIQKYLMSYGFRYNQGNWFQYMNGNGIIEFNKNDGTLITTLLDDEDFIAEFPLNMDVNISNKCINGCKFCYQGCTKDGDEADLKAFVKTRFFESLRPGTELALNGNEPLHKDLDVLLSACKDKEVMANLTVRYNTFVDNREQLLNWQKYGKIHGIGISVCDNMDMAVFEGFDNIVFHTIYKVTTPEIFELLFELRCKVLLLGYKTFGFGVEYIDEKAEENKKYVDENLDKWISATKESTGFSVLSFDNLALEQLSVESKLDPVEWALIFRGDDGGHTQYLDLVTLKFCKNSIVPDSERFDLGDLDVIESFNIMRNAR